MPRDRRQPINLALQGGGAHGAFTWGVLDALLEADRLRLDWVSATSAGAVNAVALAAGLAEGGPEHARAKLAEIWEAINQAGVPEFLRRNPLIAGLTRMYSLAGGSIAGVTSVLSPYDLNPFDVNPLKSLLVEAIDFERLRARPPLRLLLAATDAATGRGRLFREHELTVDAVLASACLPTLHRTVEIDGRFYWDGGFSANPDILTLAGLSATSDTLLVLLNPRIDGQLPRKAHEIAAGINRLTFNAPLMREVDRLLGLRARYRGMGRFFADAALRRQARHRFHLIDASALTATLDHESKLKPDWKLLTSLHDEGRAAARKWLDAEANHVGRRATVDLRTLFPLPVGP